MEKHFDIIMFNMSSYSDWAKGVQNRNYHILHSIERLDYVRRIVAVDFLPYNTKQALKIYINDIVKNTHGGDIVYGDLTSECHQLTSKVFNYATVDSVYSMNRVITELHKIKKILDLHNIIVWSYNPLFIEYFHRLDQILTVFDTVDNWIEHSAFTNYKQRLTENYKYIGKESDVIFSVSEKHKEFYNNFGRKSGVHPIANGIDSHYFNTENILDVIKPVATLENIKKNGRPIIGYIGTIQEDRIDIDLLEGVIKANKDKDIVLCGPVWKSMVPLVEKRLSIYSNVHLLGRVKRDEWIDYCRYFDVAINPHKVNVFNDYTDPTKIYEYLACGKPVVTTNVGGVEAFGDFISVAKNTEEFIQKINNEYSINSIAKAKERMRKALFEYTWDHRVEGMFKVIMSHPKMVRFLDS